jgi:hypothetical protein
MKEEAMLSAKNMKLIVKLPKFSLMFYSPCITVYQYNEADVMHLDSVYLKLRASTCFAHYLPIFKRHFTNGTWYIACVLCQLAATRVGVDLRSIPTLVKPT